MFHFYHYINKIDETHLSALFFSLFVFPSCFRDLLCYSKRLIFLEEREKIISDIFSSLERFLFIFALISLLFRSSSCNHTLFSIRTNSVLCSSLTILDLRFRRLPTARFQRRAILISRENPCLEKLFINPLKILLTRVKLFIY